jgi:hypothetical protein
VYLEEYDMDLARFLCSGADVWLSTPLKPHEASGTSGMKAALNGVPSLRTRAKIIYRNLTLALADGSHSSTRHDMHQA